MKTLIISSLFLLSTSAFAGKCLLSGLVASGEDCHRISTRLDVSDVEACRAFAKSTESSKFFGQIDKDEKLISTRYLYRVNVIKRLKGSVEFAESSCQ